MFLTPIALVLAAADAPASTVPSAGEDVRKQFVALYDKGDKKACLDLFLAHPGETLPAIDRDLEGSLKLRETSKEPDRAKIEAMHARALWGAEIATEALVGPMVLDYASSFVGWDEAQGKRFREGQKAFKEAMADLQKNDAKAALEAGQRCLECASPLGDWWGAAMACDAIAAAQKALGNPEKALEAAAHARLIYCQLGLRGDELEALIRVATACKDLGRPVRGRVACDAGISLARFLDQEQRAKDFGEMRAEFTAQIERATGTDPGRTPGKAPEPRK